VQQIKSTPGDSCQLMSKQTHPKFLIQRGSLALAATRSKGDFKDIKLCPQPPRTRTASAPPPLCTAPYLQIFLSSSHLVFLTKSFNAPCNSICQFVTPFFIYQLTSTLGGFASGLRKPGQIISSAYALYLSNASVHLTPFPPNAVY
jgi:hypothetical protein